MDIRAGGRPRASRGKGVRSVLHSAFTTSLAQFCQSNDRPHPGFIVLDSPVVTYRDPINEEPIGEDVDLTPHVVDHFYRDMLDFPGQAVILENGDPPADVLSAARVTGSQVQAPAQAGAASSPSRPWTAAEETALRWPVRFHRLTALPAHGIGCGVKARRQHCCKRRMSRGPRSPCRECSHCGEIGDGLRIGSRTEQFAHSGAGSVPVCQQTVVDVAQAGRARDGDFSGCGAVSVAPIHTA